MCLHALVPTPDALLFENVTQDLKRVLVRRVLGLETDLGKDIGEAGSAEANTYVTTVASVLERAPITNDFPGVMCPSDAARITVLMPG